MGHKKSIGLPGGPNEFLQDITQYISIEGYKSDSPDKNNPVNIIESGSITMEDVDFPVMGTDNLGNSEMMMPGNNYQFPGDSVLEVPMAQTGYEVPKRNGVRLNYDEQGKVIGESSHIMKAEVFEGKWYGFPTLFQNDDNTWDNTFELLIKENEKNWMPAFEEAKRRGELIEFGADKESAIKFGEGSWKPKAQDGGSTSWNWKGKSYSGTLIPSMETETNRYARTENGKIKTLPKAQYAGENNFSRIRPILGNAEESLNEWLDYSMNGVDGIDQVLTKEQIDYYDSFQQDIREREAAIYDDIEKKNIPYGSKNWTPIEMDPRMIAIREEQIKFDEDNPIYNETQNLLWEASDPIRHSTSSANTSKALQQKVRDVPYIGGLLDFLGVDKAVGFVGANALGIGHEAMTLPDDDRDWETKLKESGQDIYNNFKGSLEGNKNLNSRDTVNNLLEQYKLGNLADGTVMTSEQEAQLELDKLNEAEHERRLKNALNQMVNGTLTPSGNGEPQMGFEVIEEGNLENLTSVEQQLREDIKQFNIDPMQEGGCTSCTESMRQREGSYNKGKEYILDPRFKQEGGSTTNPYTIYMNYINGIDESEVAQNIFDKLNRMHYRDAKTRGMGVANYIASNIIPNS